MKHTRSAVPAVLALLAMPFAMAQGIPSDSVLRGFQPTGEYTLIVDGVPIPGAEIYQNDQIPAMLILTSALPAPVILTPRSGKAETVNLMKVSKQKDGSVDLLADAVLAPLGQFTTEGENVSFSYQGKKVRLNPRPALLGVKSNADLKGYLPDYVRNARSYTPNAAAVADLKKLGTPVTVRVFFGSWCPHCRQHVPLLLKVEDQVQNPKLRFEYYGLPRDFKDPEAKKAGINSVPIGIVFVNGKEAGRITGEGWNSPEVLLDRIVNGPAARPVKGK
ncbi:MAG: thioredoxin family protein [Thermoanaerobaculia bacterium]